MPIKSLQLTNYKNYNRQNWTFDQKLVLFYGLNGVGKTNALDAVHHLCLGKAYIQSMEKFLFRKGEQLYRLEGHFSNGDKVVIKNALDRKKTISCNDITYDKISEHVGRYPVIMITPDDVSLINEGNEQRRRFTDMAISQIDRNYLSALTVYKRILAQRNQYLKQCGRDRQKLDLQLLQVYDDKLDKPAQLIFQKRSAFFTAFGNFFQKSYAQLASANEVISIEYSSQLSDRTFLKGMAQSLALDKLSMRSNFGIHKDQVGILLNGVPLRKIGSQGQRKTAVFALKFGLGAFINNHETTKPIIILDDLFDKLDIERIMRIVQLLDQENFDQIFISDTQLQRFKDIWVQVNKGTTFQSIHIQRKETSEEE